MSTAIAMAHFIAGLKHRSEEVRFKTANDLHHFVSTELREMPLDEHTSFMDEFNHHIFEMVSSSDINERKGGILAIGKFVKYVDSITCITILSPLPWHQEWIFSTFEAVLNSFCTMICLHCNCLL